MRIRYIGRDRDVILKVAMWQQEEFGYLNPSTTIEDRINRLNDCKDGDRLPINLVASFDDCNIVGSAGLLAKSIIPGDLSPWLSSVYVPQQYRGKGIASALSLRIAHEAAILGYERIYLFTPKSEHLYARLGWVTFEKLDHRGTPLALMWRSTRSVQLDELTLKYAE